MNAYFPALSLVFGLSCAAIAGCSGDAEPTTGSASPVRGGPPVVASAPTPAPRPTPAPPPAPPTVSGSQLTADLAAAGLDPRALPPLDTLDPRTRIKVMKTFTRALGVQCNFCHDTSNYEASTPNKRIAARMWSDFVRGLALRDGSVLYCDSCHAGHSEILDRSDIPKLRAWMAENFVGKLQRTDGAEHRCRTCHGDPFQGDIFKDVWHVE